MKACCRYKTYLGSSIHTTCRAELCSRIRPRIAVTLPAPCPRARIRDCFNQGAAPQCQLKSSQVQYWAHKVSAWLLPRLLLLEAAKLLLGMPRSCHAQQGAGPKQCQIFSYQTQCMNSSHSVLSGGVSEKGRKVGAVWQKPTHFCWEVCQQFLGLRNRASPLRLRHSEHL